MNSNQKEFKSKGQEFHYCLRWLKESGLKLDFEREDCYMVYNRETAVNVFYCSSFDEFKGFCWGVKKAKEL